MDHDGYYDRLDQFYQDGFDDPHSYHRPCEHCGDHRLVCCYEGFINHPDGAMDLRAPVCLECCVRHQR